MTLRLGDVPRRRTHGHALAPGPNGADGARDRDRHRGDGRGRRHLRVEPRRPAGRARPARHQPAPGARRAGRASARRRTCPRRPRTWCAGSARSSRRPPSPRSRPRCGARTNPRRWRPAAISVTTAEARPARHARRDRADRTAGSTTALSDTPTVVLGANGGRPSGHHLADRIAAVWIGDHWFTVVGILDPVPLLGPTSTPRCSSVATRRRRCSTATASVSTIFVRTRPRSGRRRPRRARRHGEPAAPERGRGLAAVRRARRPCGRRPRRSPRCCSGSAAWPCWSAASASPT